MAMRLHTNRKKLPSSDPPRPPRPTPSDHSENSPPVDAYSPSQQGGVGGDPPPPSNPTATPSQTFSANSAWSFYVGEERNVYHFFRDHIASKSPALKTLMDMQAEKGGPKEITWPNATGKQFDIYYYYVYHDRLPTSILRLEDPELKSPNTALVFLLNLYLAGMRLEDFTFANRVLDLTNEIQCEHAITLKLILRSSEDPLLHEFCEFFTARFIMQCVNESDDLEFRWFTETLPFNPAHAKVYYSFCKYFTAYHASPPEIKKWMRVPETCHQHRTNDVCYSEKCNDLRQHKIPDTSGSDPAVSGGPGAP